MTARHVRRLLTVGLLSSLAALGVGVASLGLEVGQTWSGIPVFRTGDVGPRVLASPAIYADIRLARPQTRIVSIDRQPMADGRSVLRYVRARAPGESAEFAFETVDGTRFRRSIELMRFSADDALMIYSPVMLLGLLFLVVTVTPAFARPQLPAARASAIMGMGLASNFTFLLPDYFMGHRLTPFSFVFGLMGVGGLLQLGLTFPSIRPPLRRFPRATLIGLYGLLSLFWIAFANAFGSDQQTLHALEYVEIGILLLGLALLIGNLALSAREAAAKRRRQSRLILPGVSLFGLTAVALAASTYGWLDVYVPPALYLVPIPFVVTALGRAMVSAGLFDLDGSSRRVLSRATFLMGTLTLFSVLVVLFTFFTAATTAWTAAAVLTLVTTGSLPLIPAISHRIDDAVEQNLFPQRRRVRESLEALAREIGRLRTQDNVVALLRRGTEDMRSGAPLHVLSGPPDGPLEEVAPAPGSRALSVGTADPLLPAIRAQASLLPQSARDRRGQKGLEKAAAARKIEIMLPLGESQERVASLLVGERPSGQPFDVDDAELLQNLAGPISLALENAVRLEELEELRKRVESENLYLRAQIDEEYDGSEMVGRSEGIRTAVSQLMRVARTDASVLIVGETGTGKELAVRTLHRASERADRVMVKLACAALPEHLLESELFGHEKGAFTGADRTREGRFEIADGGTIFFDDVDTLSLPVQAKLLRAIQEGEVQRLGSNFTRQVDVRIVAATNRRLEDEVRAGRFREDLFYRLAVVPVHLPPLRERREDIPLLVEHLVHTESQRLGRQVREISSEAMRALLAWEWPGNIRELRNVIERALVLSEGDVLRLPGPLGGEAANTAPTRPAEDLKEAVSHHLGNASLQEILQRYKKALIESALERSDGNQSRAAELLGLHRPSLSRMIRDLEKK